MQFTSQLEEKASNTRSEPQTTEVETVTSVHQQVSKSESVTFYNAIATEQDPSSGASDMVPCQPSVATNGSSNYKIVDVLHQVTSLLTTREVDLTRKKGKVKLLKGRNEEVEVYLIEKESKIKQLEQ